MKYPNIDNSFLERPINVNNNTIMMSDDLVNRLPEDLPTITNVGSTTNYVIALLETENNSITGIIQSILVDEDTTYEIRVSIEDSLSLIKMKNCDMRLSLCYGDIVTMNDTNVLKSISVFDIDVKLQLCTVNLRF